MSKNFYKMTLTEKQKWVKDFINKNVSENEMEILPVKFSNRMTRTLGQFTFKLRYNENMERVKDRAKEFKISNKMLKEATLTSIKDTLLHEIAHYLTDFKYYPNELNHHNKNFKKVCKMLNCDGMSQAKDYRRIKK